MTITVNCKGLHTPGGDEDRDIAYLDVEYNGNVYDWLIYVPQRVNLSEYIEESKPRIQADIDRKELEWENLTPKTRVIVNAFDPEGNTVVEITKDEIVRADYPDYYANRRAEYPSYLIYIDGVVKNDAEQIQSYIDACVAVKNKYPKPQ